ncbi:vacuolar protein sorting-associated protein 13A-like [Stylophora pistillata]|uniref:vacuolar protein sorting-associated protein 13A-like n=1 Tax=Stylophora pistillata TaxID=50429 RepID=UPI000C0568D2|nr:vacuolar protein sorting-associated protein 13A-like [Stylophora pistillata]
MLESLAASILNGVLGKYIKDLDSSNLELGILSGNVVLTDLELRDDALDAFHLPIEVTHGYVGKISLTIPWTNLYSEPFDIAVHDVYLIARPIRERTYDPVKAKASEIAAKRERLTQIEQRIEDTDINKEKPKDTEEGSDSFVDKLLAQVLKNLKISVKNIHFRYEDKVTSPNKPFTLGFTLQNLSAETTNELWQECVVDASAKTIYKIVSLDCLSVYWNTNQTSMQFFSMQDSWKELMSHGVSSKRSVPSNYEFILKPLSAECHVVMDQSSEIVLDTPKLLIEVLQQELSLVFTQTQFQNVMDLIESFESMTINQMYLKYQPTSPVKEDPAAWWKYAYTAICEEKFRTWSWNHIKEHRRKYHLYKHLWERKLKGLSEGEESSLGNSIQSLEDKLDIPSILIARRHAEIEVPPSQRFNPNKKRKSKPWWLWLGIGSESSTDYEGVTNQRKQEEDIWSKFSVAALPVEEKEKLYKAIDYSESVRVKYPTEFIKSRVTFNLDKCTFELLDTTNCKIAQLDTEGFDVTLEHRPAQGAFRFHGKINRFKMLGCSEGATENELILVSSKSTLNRQETALVQCTLETKPLEVKADYAASLKVEPVEAIYDAHTIDKIIAFLYMPENSKLQELGKAAANKLQNLRRWTRAGLEYAITHHEVTYLDLDVRSPFVVIPEYGTLERDGSVLAVDLGHLKVVSNLASRDTSVRAATEHELEEMFYDKFEVTLDDVQVMMFNKDVKWQSMQSVSSSPHHILPSTALGIKLQNSITTDNLQLPEFKVSSVLPSLHLKFSDEKYKMLMKFLNHLPFGVQQPVLLEEKRSDAISKTEWRHSSSTLSLEEANDLEALFKDAMATRFNSNEDEDVQWYDAQEYLPHERPEDDQTLLVEAHEVDKIKLAGDFTIEKLLITVDKVDEQEAAGNPYLSLEIRDVGTDLVAHSWDLHAKIKIGFIQLTDNNWKDVDGSNLCVLTSSATDDWITVNYVKADTAGPEFKEKFQSIEQLIEMRFSSLKLTAKQEAIASFQIFVMSLFQSEPEWTTIPQRFLETIREEDDPDGSVGKELVKGEDEGKKAQSDIDVVHFKIVAQIEEVTVILSSMDRHVGKVHVTGLDVSIDVVPAEVDITTKLNDLDIEDLTDGTLYPQILDLADNTVFECKVS